MFQNAEIHSSSVAQVCFTSEFQFQGERKWSINLVFAGIKINSCLWITRMFDCTETEGPIVIWEVLLFLAVHANFSLIIGEVKTTKSDRLLAELNPDRWHYSIQASFGEVLLHHMLESVQ